MGILAELERRKLTQTRAAAIAGISQPRMSDLMRGCVDPIRVSRRHGW